MADNEPKVDKNPVEQKKNAGNQGSESAEVRGVKTSRRAREVAGLVDRNRRIITLISLGSFTAVLAAGATFAIRHYLGLNQELPDKKPSTPSSESSSTPDYLTDIVESSTPSPSPTPEPTSTPTETLIPTATSIFSHEQLERSFFVNTPGGPQRVLWDQELAANPNHKVSYYDTKSIDGYFKITMRTGELPNNVLMFRIPDDTQDPIDNLVAVEGIKEENGGPLIFYVPKIPGKEIAAWEIFDSPYQYHSFDKGIAAYGTNPNTGKEMVKTGNQQEFKSMEGFFFTLRDHVKNRTIPTPTSISMRNNQSLQDLHESIRHKDRKSRGGVF